MVDVQLVDGLPLDYVYARSSLAKEVKASIEGLLPAGHAIVIESNSLGRTTYLILDQSKKDSIRGKITIESEVTYLLNAGQEINLEMITERLNEFSPVKCREIINHYAKKWLKGEPC